MEFQCERCRYTAKTKANLIRHLRKQAPCASSFSSRSVEDILTDMVKEKKYSCSVCSKGFTNEQSKRRHERSCENVERLKLLEDLKTIQEQHVKELQCLREELQKSTASTNIVNSNNTINNFQQNITINAFGKEDISYISHHPNLSRFLAKCLKEQSEGLCEYIAKKHLNHSHPENNNIRKLNKKDKFIDYYNGNEWKISNADRMLEKILTGAEEDIQRFVNENPPDRNLRNAANAFMEGTGVSLSWNLNGDNYEFDEEDIGGDDGEKRKKQIKQHIFGLLCEYVYRYSKNKQASSCKA